MIDFAAEIGIIDANGQLPGVRVQGGGAKCTYQYTIVWCELAVWYKLTTYGQACV